MGIAPLISIGWTPSLIVAASILVTKDMRDLGTAKEILKKRDLSLVIVKEDEILFESRSSGIKGLLQAIDKFEEGLDGSSVADRVVGRAAALLLAYSRVKEVYAATLSDGGLEVLKENSVRVEHDNLVPKILDRKGENICPFEKFSLTITSVEEAYRQLRAFAENLQRKP